MSKKVEVAKIEVPSLSANEMYVVVATSKANKHLIPNNEYEATGEIAEILIARGLVKLK